MAMSSRFAQIAAQAAVNAYKNNRRRRVAANKWVLGSRLLGYGFDPRTTPIGIGRRFMKRRRAGKRGFKGYRPRMTQQSQTVSQPVSVGSIQRRQTAAYSRTENGCDFVDVVRANYEGPDTYNCESYSVNPAETDTFARIPTIAREYQKYKVHKMTLDFVPVKGSAQTGTVCIGLSANPQTPNPEDMTAMQGLYGSVNGPVNVPCSVPFPPSFYSKVMAQYQVKQNQTPLEEDDNPLTSVGRVYVATEGCGEQQSVIVGRLSVTYSITFYDPILEPGGSTCSEIATFTEPDESGDIPAFEHNLPVDALWRTKDNYWQCRNRTRTLMFVHVSGTAPTLELVNPAGSDLDSQILFGQELANECNQLYMLESKQKFKFHVKSGTASGGTVYVAPYPGRW